MSLRAEFRAAGGGSGRVRLGKTVLAANKIACRVD
jgi:hypothetical protein